MSTPADIWEVMAEEISNHPHDRLEMFRGRNLTFDASITYGSTGVDEVLASAKSDPDSTPVVDAAAELAAACARYNVTPEEVHNSRVRHTAVTVARVSIATRLSVAGWTGVAIGEFLFHRRTNLSHMLRGGRGKGILPSSRIGKDLVARRLAQSGSQPQSFARPSSHSGNRGYPRIEQAAWALRRLRDNGEEPYIQRVVTKYFPELSLRQVYEAAFGADAAPLTLEEARAAEARGEGVVKFVGGVPQWFRTSPPPQTTPDRAAPLAEETPAESRLPLAG